MSFWSFLHKPHCCTLKTPRVINFFNVQDFWITRYIIIGKFLKMIYHALIESVIQYSITVWGGAYNNVVSPISRAILNIKKLFPSESDNVLNFRQLYLSRLLYGTHLNKKLLQSPQTYSLCKAHINVPRPKFEFF